MLTLWRGWQYWRCIQTSPVQCPCEKQDQIYLKLRGKCPESVIDTFWSPQNEEGLYVLHGSKTSEIRYIPETSSWKLEAISGTQFSTASTTASFHSFLLGKNSWIITNDKGFYPNNLDHRF